MKNILLILNLSVSLLCAGQNAFTSYERHIHPNKLILIFREDVTAEEKARLISASGLVNSFTHLPAPALTICEVSDRLRAGSFFNALPEVRAVSFFITDGKHNAGVLNSFFVKLSDKIFEPLLNEKLIALHLPLPVADKYIPNLYLVENSNIKTTNTIDICKLLEAEGWCSYASPNYLLNPLVTSNDPLYNRQWAIANTGTALQGNGTPDADMDVDSAWTVTTGSTDIKVAIVDSGVDTLHNDLIQNLLPGHDAVSDSTDGYPTPSYDNDGHGTCCAGIVAAVQNNNIGISGVAPSCKIIPVRAFYYVLLQGASDPLPYSTAAAFADAIGWSWSVANADIMSNSWGLPPSLISFLPGGMQPVNDAIATAYASGRGGKGTAMFFSSGNENDSIGPIWPGKLAQTIAVNATTMCDERKSPTDCSGENWWGGDHGPGLDFSAPGVKISTTDMRGGLGFTSNDYTYTFNGTSAACPNAAAVGALVLSLRPELHADDVRNILARSCDKVGGYSYDSIFVNGTWCPELGFGRINAFKAIQESFNYSKVKEIEKDLSFQIFPNPASSEISISSMYEGTKEIILVNALGEVVLQKIVEGNTANIDISAITSGFYIVQMNALSGSGSLKLSVVK